MRGCCRQPTRCTRRWPRWISCGAAGLAIHLDPGHRAEAGDALAHAFEVVVAEVVVALGHLTFSDNVAGSESMIRFPAPPPVTLVQMHLFRQDDGVMTQFVVTTDILGTGAGR